MYFDWRLFAMTRGVRLRILLAALIGLAALPVSLARLASRASSSPPLSAGVPDPDARRAAARRSPGSLVLRALLQYWREDVANRTAAEIKLRLRGLALRARARPRPRPVRPAAAPARCCSTLVEGVEMLETFFGQYLPQFLVAALTPLIVFAFMAVLDLPTALIFLVFALFTLIVPCGLPALERRQLARRRREAYAALGSDFLDGDPGPAHAQSVRPEPRPRRAAGRARARRSTAARWACWPPTSPPAASPCWASRPARRWRSAGARCASSTASYRCRRW